MSSRFLWPLAGLLGIAGLMLMFTTSSAQPMAGGGWGISGRFVVAHASDKQVLVLDTATGQVYSVTEFKAAADMPKLVGPPVGRPGGERPADRGRPGGERPRDRGRPEGERPRDRGRPEGERPREAPPERERPREAPPERERPREAPPAREPAPARDPAQPPR